MRPFDYQRPRTRAALREAASTARWLAGGTDLLPLMKLGIEAPPALIDLKTVGLPADITEREGRLWLGALCSLEDIASSPLLAQHWPLLGQAAAQSASPQLRRRATLGGNLLQRPRCWYFRDPARQCWLKGG